jgi:hypothetical protein
MAMTILAAAFKGNQACCSVVPQPVAQSLPHQ